MIGTADRVKMRNDMMKIPTWIALALLPVMLDCRAETLAERFDNPPDSAKPATWWHWMNANVGKEGITADLEWMKRIGLGGAQIFETSQVAIPGKAIYGGDYWQDCIKFAIEECARLGLEFGMHNCSGWNNSAGPQVEPEDAMKKLVFARMTLNGPAGFSGKLPQPHVEQVMPFSHMNAMNRNLKEYGFERTNYPAFYRDIAVFAFSTPPDAAVSMADAAPQLEAPSAVAAVAASALWDDDPLTRIEFDPRKLGRDASAEVTLRFDKPFTARSVYIMSGEGGLQCTKAELLAAEDGNAFKTIKTIRMPQNGGPLREEEGLRFDPVSAKAFRLRLTGLKKGPWPASLAELVLSGDARIERWPVKAGFLRGRGNDTEAAADAPDAGQIIPRDKLIDLTSRLKPDGGLDWEVPPGSWTVLRIGTTITGKMNHPATPGGLGLEVDKLNKDAFERYISNGVMQKVVDLAGKDAGGTLKSFATDSWEVGAQNWTDGMKEEFRKRRGYDPTPYLPCLAGQIVESAEVSDRFLWDFRVTISDVWAENFFGTFRDFCRRHGMTSSAEPYNNANFNDLQMGGYVDDVAPVFWMGKEAHEGGIRSMVSLANTYGLKRVEAEAYTGGTTQWTEHPGNMKALGDVAFAYGINRYVFHRSAHQPWKDIRQPGIMMGPFGIHFERTQTWAEQAKAWITYITRCQALLQSGKYVADPLFFIGEGSPNQFTNTRKDLGLPDGYGYDGCDRAILLHHASVKDGRIVLKSGMSYAFLVLPESGTMTPELAAKVRDLVRDGATVAASRRPVRSPSLANYPACDTALRGIADELFGDLDGKARKERAFGKGRVFLGLPVADVLSALAIEPDFQYTSSAPEAVVRSIHRKTDDTDFYFAACDREEPVKAELSFRIPNGQPELWDPYHATRVVAPNVRHENGRTIVPVEFEPAGSVFVVFPQKPTTGAEVISNFKSQISDSLSGPWRVEFQPGRGAPESITLDALVDWTKHPDDGVKFFSGTATYSAEFEISNLKSQIHLDLGEVGVLAEVKVNGTGFEVLWKKPFRVDITKALKAGSNTLEVKVTNLWNNRLIGDERQFPQKNPYWWARGKKWPEWVGDSTKPNPTGRIAFATWPVWKAEDPLLPSGLLGPVRLLSVSKVEK
jgi:hypothetical protein